MWLRFITLCFENLTSLKYLSDVLSVLINNYISFLQDIKEPLYYYFISVDLLCYTASSFSFITN